jgi:hypothetical protein
MENEYFERRFSRLLLYLSSPLCSMSLKQIVARRTHFGERVDRLDERRLELRSNHGNFGHELQFKRKRFDVFETANQRMSCTLSLALKESRRRSHDTRMEYAEMAEVRPQNADRYRSVDSRSSCRH